MTIVNIIKYEGDNRTFAWKHLCEGFDTRPQLVVCGLQKAAYFYNGQVHEPFGSGRYALELLSILLTSNLINIPSDGKSPFQAEFYFVNLVKQMGITRGTNLKVQYMDPEFGSPLTIGVSGEMTLVNRNAIKHLIYISGTETIFSQDRLISYSKVFLRTPIKTIITQVIVKNRFSILKMDAQFGSSLAAIKQSISHDFVDYGFKLSQFLMTNIIKSEDNSAYKEFKDTASDIIMLTFKWHKLNREQLSSRLRHLDAIKIPILSHRLRSARLKATPISKNEVLMWPR
ncbi:MAG: SPFH domain-containing protein [Coriobacteriales bacterium]|nr:SPFH domain-containing protein [Coriobacteriales bacterium]